MVQGDEELGKAASLFSGPIEVMAEHPEFGWLEGPVWSESGQFLLFSDVTWEDESNVTCGMIWKYDNTVDIDDDGLSKFIECSGLIGPGDTPANIDNYVEAGSNGLEWGWKGDAADGGDLLICQHGKHRLVRINLNDVDEATASIDPAKVVVLADMYMGKGFNSPNDLVLDGDTLYFTDPPFGLQMRSSGDQAIADAFANLTQDAVGVYTITGDPGAANSPVEPVRVLDYGSPTDPWEGTNGVAVLPNGDMICPISNFEDPRFELFAQADKTNDGTTFNMPASSRLESTYRIQGANSGFPALTDGITYSPDHNVLFGSGPGGVYMFNGTAPYELLGFLRIDDLNANNVVGGGYLWLTANKKLLRIPLANATATGDDDHDHDGGDQDHDNDGDSGTDNDGDSGTSTSTSTSGAFSMNCPITPIFTAIAIAVSSYSLLW
ncbi:gluconolactonase [Seminavis robusta]|uniref:Gluconolactonase n=1 Tax=Seminavis robusta TaxID=568900 RepID=A0A9N8DFU8_9STRA|nr:gluconolactonase [Seminavis robusta]|eukprot:Sro123_g059760.1 gluconolactonase (EC 3.1.1.17) (437) ;mRNA; r:107711-109021